MTVLGLASVAVGLVAALISWRALRQAKRIYLDAAVARADSVRMKADAAQALDAANQALTHAQAIYSEHVA